MSNTLEETQRHAEMVAMNIVHQIGDALYEALPKDVAHEHFVDARQATNDKAIDFAMKLILSEARRAKVGVLQELIDDDVLVYWNDDRDTDGHIFISSLKEKLLELTGGKE